VAFTPLKPVNVTCHFESMIIPDFISGLICLGFLQNVWKNSDHANRDRQMTGFFSSLRIRLLLIVFFAALPALAVIIYSGLGQRQLAKDAAVKEMLNKTLTIATFQKLVFEEAHRELAILAKLPAVRDQNPKPCSAVLANFLKTNPSYVNLGLADGSGKIVCSALPVEKEHSIADRHYFQTILKTGRFAVGAYQVGRISAKVSIGVGYPILDVRGNPERVIFAGLDLTWLQNFLNESAGGLFDPKANITVIDVNGTVLARWPEGAKWAGLHRPQVEIIKTSLTEGKGTTEAYGLDGVHKLYAFSPLDRTRQVGFIYAGIPTAALYSKMDRELARNLIILGLAIVLTLTVAWFSSSQLVLSRITPLINAARRISAGDLSARTGLAYGKGEIDHLARDFDEMAAELQRRAEAVNFANRTLSLANQAAAIEQLLQGFSTEIKNYTRCAAVGIRVLREDGKIPYQVCQGFSQEFYELESPLSTENDACMCVNVIKGATDPKLPYYTEYGSFYLNQATYFLASRSPEDEGKTRNVCNKFGYESVALVPLRVGSQLLGLIHVADSQADMVPLRLVEELEKVSMRLGQALKRLQAEENIRTLSHELIKAQEQEKQRISRELHDSAAQELSVLKIGLENLQHDLSEKSVEESSLRISQLVQKLQQTLSSIRTLSYDLRPPDLEHFGLVQVIKTHCEEFTARTGIKVDFMAAGIEAGHLDDDAAINFHRIIQEGLTNVWRHSQAMNVNIRLVASFPKIILRLEDDGQGFDVMQQEASRHGDKHLGLLGMRERVALLGGAMKIESQRNKGTKISIEIPWKGEDLGAKEEAPHC
jgi:signal transduction histidine kinase